MMMSRKGKEKNYKGSENRVDGAIIQASSGLNLGMSHPTSPLSISL